MINKHCEGDKEREASFVGKLLHVNREIAIEGQM
jgi:hypothetical protein